MRTAIPLMRARLDLQPPACLFATDAMGASSADAGGFGVVGTPTCLEEVREVVRGARQLSFTVARLDGDQSGLKRPERALQRTIPKTTLPSALLDKRRWLPVERGRWHDEDHITLGEARVVVRLLRRLAGHPRWHHTFLLSLEDNRPVVGCFTKGRSPSSPLNHMCRQKSAALLATGSRLLLPWVETLKQPADDDSRILY